MEDASSTIFVSATDLREWIITTGACTLHTDTDTDGYAQFKRVIHLLYAYNCHPLASALYIEVKELKALQTQLAYTVSRERKTELKEVILRKWLSIVDVLPELDKIHDLDRAA